jgi:hypothetical protein
MAEHPDRALIDSLADQIAICAAHIDSAQHQLLSHIRAFDNLKGWCKQGSKSCAHWLSWRIGLGLVAAREKVRVAHALATLPSIDAALERGELSYAKVRAMTRVADPDNEGLLLAQARGTTGAELERICSGFRPFIKTKAALEERRYVRRRSIADGTMQIEIRLLPDEAARFWQALSEARRGLGSESDSAESSSSLPDAAVLLAERAIANASQPTRVTAAAERRQLFVHLAESRLRPAPTAFNAAMADRALESPTPAPPWQAALHDGTAINGDTLLRLACDSGLVVAKTDAHGSVLDIGRRRRTVSPALLRALRLRDRRCRFPGCNHAAFVDAHHIEHWAAGGATALRNLVLVCHAHHVALHEGGFSVSLESGAPIFADPTGTVIPHAAPTPALDNAMNPLRIAHRVKAIRIDHRTSLIRRGWLQRPNLKDSIRALVRRYDWHREELAARGASAESPGARGDAQSL